MLVNLCITAAAAVSVLHLTAAQTFVGMGGMLGNIANKSWHAAIVVLMYRLVAKKIIAILTGMGMTHGDSAGAGRLEGYGISVSCVVNVYYGRAVTLNEHVLIGKRVKIGEVRLVADASKLTYSIASADERA